MEFEIDQPRFLSALALAQTVADRKGTTPVLANVLLRADGDTLTLCATDMMTALTERIPCKTATPGALTIGVRYLHSVVKTVKAGALRLKALDNAWAQLLAGRSEFKLMGLPATDFPEVPSADGVEFAEVDGHALANLIGKTLFSVCQDEARVNLNGALLECDGESATMVSTDGHRLTKYTLPLAGPKLGRPVIIPRKGLEEIRKTLARCDGEVSIGVQGSFFYLRTDDLLLSVKLNDVTFPPYNQVIPKASERRVGVDRAELVGALRQAVVIAPEKTATVRVEVGEGRIGLAADNPELGAIKLELPAEFEGEDGIEAGFNAQYLLEALQAIDDERAVLDFQGPLDPVKVSPATADGTSGADFIAVVMPMRI